MTIRKTLCYAAVASLLWASSCKENVSPLVLANSGGGQDTAYLLPSDSIPAAQTKRYYIEEISGFTCSNCPAGAAEIELLESQNQGQGGSLISSISFQNAIGLNEPFNAIEKLFITDFGANLVGNVFNANGDGWPAAIFDRLPLNASGNIGSGRNPLAVDGSTYWAGAFATNKSMNTSTPVNITITSAPGSAANTYNITAAVTYTQAVTTTNALNIYLSQDSIINSQELSPVDIDTAYVFMHVFRFPITGNNTAGVIIPQSATGTNYPAGWQYTYSTTLTINPSDPEQQYWVPKNMNVTAFVTVAGNPNDIHVLQVQQTPLTQ